MNILLNGCSYGSSWGTQLGKLAEKMNYDDYVNISKPGSCNERIFRTTHDYLQKNKVDFVLLSLTFWDRQEAPWASKTKTGSHWIDYSPKGIITGLDRLADIENIDCHQKFIKSRYMYDISNSYIEKLLLDLIFFTGWLTSKKYKYLIYSAPGLLKDETPEYLDDLLNILRKDSRVIDPTSFSSNFYLYENGGKSPDNLDPHINHYDEMSHGILANFLFNYAVKNNLL